MAGKEKKVYSKGALKRREKSKKLSKKKAGRKRLDTKYPQLADKVYLDGAYNGDGKSLTTIGREIGVSHGVVWAAMKRAGVKLRTRKEAKRTIEVTARKKSPRVPQHTTLAQRLNMPPCPNCDSKGDWYLPLKSDTALCQSCDTWFVMTPDSGTVQLEETV